MRILYLFSFVFLLITINLASSQEICDNENYDNNKGHINLNNTGACAYHSINAGAALFPSFIPNPSFELTNCCPSGYSQMSCAASWIQASSATSDYMNTCNYVCQAATFAGLVPFPDGNGIVGIHVLQDFKEYVGVCLSQPMIAGETYTIQMSVASTPADGNLDPCGGGVIYYSALDMTIYGSTACANLPFTGFDCPPSPQWMVLGSVSYTPVSTWGTIAITFTPTVNIEAIVIGAPCILPPSYNFNNGSSCSQYFYFDNILLDNSSTTIADVQLINSVKLYPNPASNTVSISFMGSDKDVSIELIDALGKIVYKKEVIAVNGTIESLNIASLSRGIYSVHILSSGKNYNQRLVIN